ncbi:MAG: HYR domain-containing protein, partial [Saprospiraceae bacterium]|nr:HYR domain-containing protein [Saprospiraceae bacterium]MDW8484369.1 HYR domain-containing protein [Saprospiraceae bacterium]
MKKRNTFMWVVALLACLVSHAVIAQTNVNHPFNSNAGTFTNTGAAGFFYNYYDDGGPTFNYSNNQCYLTNRITFAPSNPVTHRTRVTFTSFSVESSWDPLYIFNSATAGTNPVPGGGGAPVGVGGGCPSAPAGGFYTSPGTIIANTGIAAVGSNPSEALSFSFASDFSVTLAGWAAVVDQIAVLQCALVQPANITVNASATACPGPVPIAAPATNPSNCVTSLGLLFQYSVNGGPFQTVPYATSITVSGLQLGPNVIVWRIVNPADGLVVSSVTQAVTVVDNVPPTITCPPNVTLNLGPGACSTFYSYSVGLTDNCPFVVPQTPVQLPASFLPHGGGVVFTLQGNNAPGGYLFDLTNTGTNTATITGFGIRYGNPAFGAVNPPKQVRVWTKAGTYVGFETNPAPWSLDGGGNKVITVIPPYFATGTGPLAQVPLSTPYAVAPGAVRAFFIYGIDACPVFNYFTNVGPQTNGPWTMQGGPIAFTDFSPGPPSYFQLGAQSAPNIQVNYSIEIPAVPVQTAGLPSGAEFPIGVTTNCFRGTDVAGNTATCCFTVTVREFPNPTQNLTCNNNVQISVDQNCSAFVNADQVLEGGPYRCYDNYVVEVDKTLPFGNGPWIRVSRGPSFPGFGPPTPLGPDDVGKTYYVRVTDPSTGQMCWGSITIEDKLPPVLRCEETFVACNASTKPCVDPITILPADPVQLPASFLPHGGGVVFTLQGNNAPGGYLFDLRNNDPLPLVITGFGIRYGNPAFGAVNPPKQVRVWRRNTPGSYVGFETDASAWTLDGGAAKVITVIPPYFATGTGPLAQVPLTTEVTVQSGATQAFFIFGVDACPVFNYFSQTGPQTNGPWTMQGGPIAFTDFPSATYFQINAQSAPNIQVNYKKEAPPTCLPNRLRLNIDAFEFVGPDGSPNYRVNRGAGTPVMEACSDVTLSYSDVAVVNEPCSSPNTQTITRRWTAVDASGRVSTCLQRVNVLRPKPSDLSLPPSYDDIDKPSISCVGSAYPTPEYLESIGRQGFPYIFGKPIACGGYDWTYSDVRISVCDGTYKIRRRWTILNWCDPKLGREYDQIIKVTDNGAPTLACPANLTVGTDPFQCCATVDLPDIIVSDNCSRIKRVGARILGFDPQTNQQIAEFNVAG